MEVGDEQKSEEMAQKLAQCCYVSENGLCYLLSFPTWRWEMSGNVKNYLKSYPSAGRIEKMDFPTFSIFLHGGRG